MSMVSYCSGNGYLGLWRNTMSEEWHGHARAAERSDRLREVDATAQCALKEAQFLCNLVVARLNDWRKTFGVELQDWREALVQKGVGVFIACYHGHWRIVQELLRSDADVRGDLSCRWEAGDAIYFASTYVHAAVGSGNRQTVRLLLEHGADPEQGNGRFISALCRACAEGGIDIVKDLVEVGADVSRCVSLEALTSIRLTHRCATQAAADNEHHKIVEFLIP